VHSLPRCCSAHALIQNTDLRHQQKTQPAFVKVSDVPKRQESRHPDQKRISQQEMRKSEPDKEKILILAQMNGMLVQRSLYINLLIYQRLQISGVNPELPSTMSHCLVNTEAMRPVPFKSSPSMTGRAKFMGMRISVLLHYVCCYTMAFIGYCVGISTD